MFDIKASIRRRLRRWIWTVDTEPPEVGRDERSFTTNSMRIDIYKGAGGIAVETTVYNEAKDLNFIGFYIIHDDQDIGKELSKIITAESIKAL